MTIIMFGKWSRMSRKFLTYTRIYKDGWKWTPFVKVGIRNYRRVGDKE